MKIKFSLVATAVTLACLVRGQDSSYRNFPILVTLQFHNVTLPFKDVKSNFANIGLGVGTELSLNGRSTWAQQFSASWNFNKTVGNRCAVYTQVVWRPNLVSGFYGEVKAGAGYQYAFRPTESYQQNSEGVWQSVGHQGKGMLIVPVGISIGYQSPKPSTYVSPFVSYQLFVASGYSQSIPLLPESLIQVGSRIHFSR